MTAIMRPADIDRFFPVPGQDNESQGFRDNFDAIADSLEYAAEDLANLNTVTVKLNEVNEFTQDASVKNVKLVAHSEEMTVSGNITGNQTISYAAGSYQLLNIGANGIELTFDDWPAVPEIESGRYARIVLQLRDVSDSTNIVVTKNTFKASGSGTIQYDSEYPASLTLSSTNPHIVEFWRYNSAIVYGRYLGQYGISEATKVLQNLNVTGNTTLGDSTTDKVTFVGLPKLPNVITTVGLTGLEEGMLIYNSTTKKVQVWNGTTWIDLH